MIRSIKILFFSIAVPFLITSTLTAQQKNNSYPLPQDYLQLNSDTARMRFLAIAIADSLDEAQLSPVFDWANTGLAMAMKNNVDTMKGIFYYDIAKAYTYFYNKFDSAIVYYKKVPGYFPDRNRKYNAFSIREIMERYADLGKKDSALVYLDTLKAYIDTMPDANGRKIGLSQNIATTYQQFGMFNTAIRYYHIAINGNRLNKNFRGLGLALANLGELYNEMEDNNKAIQYSKEALQYLADVNMPYMQTAANIAEYYLDSGEYDSAWKYYTASAAVAEKINNNEQRSVLNTILARILVKQKKFSKADALLTGNLKAINETDNTFNQCKTLIVYVQLDSTLKHYDAAKRHLTDLLDISRKNEFKKFSLLALQNLSIVNAATGNYKEAFQYQDEFMKLKDSVAGDKAKADLNDLEVSYKTIEKEQEIILLKKDNDIKDLQLKENNRLKTIYGLVIVFLLAVFAIIYYQRNRRNKIETQKIKAELQTQVLRSQMNPHFIFNCLNSIENFIMQNDKRQASDYLNKFSQLIRSILDSSRNEVVPIEKDMEALKLYVELEQLRFNNKFTFSLFLDPALAGGDYRVPSLLVQPFVENAIVHGMAHSEEKELNLTVMASLEGDSIKYTIRDNGIGREKAKVYNMQNKPYHKSVGLKITEERINIYNDQPAKKEAIQIVDLYDENSKPGGTKVEIILKAI
ncbi:MAG: histidine kinase [Bacteroidetes bacterium]|nr:histidine kinase [Bacteroidota bacterium]